MTTNEKIAYLAWLVERKQNLLERFPTRGNRILWNRIYDAYKRSKFNDLPIGKGNRWKRRLEEKRLEKWRFDYARRQTERESFLLEYSR